MKSQATAKSDKLMKMAENFLTERGFYPWDDDGRGFLLPNFGGFDGGTKTSPYRNERTKWVGE